VLFILLICVLDVKACFIIVLNLIYCVSDKFQNIKRWLLMCPGGRCLRLKTA
jgi:hypothetical protein